MAEDFERVERILDISEKISMAVSNVLSIVLIISMLGDLLGINIFELMRTAVTRPWVVPTEWIQAYYPVWYGMEWALLIAMIYDQVYSVQYMHKHGEPPPPSYGKWMSMLMFFLSTWLFAIFRYATFAMIAVFSSVSLAYTWFIRRG